MPNPNLNDIFPVLNPSVLRTAAALPGAGAWDAAPIEISIANAQQITLYVTYTRGAPNGAFDFQLQVSPYAVNQVGVENWFDQALYDAGAVAVGADTDSNIQREYITYGSTGAGAETFVYGPVDLDGVSERLRIPCRESGVVGTQGIVHIVAIVA